MLMMLLAVGFLVLEMKVLSFLVVTDTMAPTMLTAGQRPSVAATSRSGQRPGQAVQPVVAGPRPMSPQPTLRQSGAFPTIPMGNFPEKRPSSPPPDGGEKMG
jgi:hypothetical protein